MAVNSYENGYSTFTSREVFRKHLEYVHDHSDQLWIDTFGTIGLYRREVDGATLRAELDGEKGLKITVQCPNLDPEVFDEPLTVVMRAPLARTVHASRNGITIPVAVRGEDVLFNVVPATEPVTVTGIKTETELGGE